MPKVEENFQNDFEKRLIQELKEQSEHAYQNYQLGKSLTLKEAKDYFGLWN
ncbi:hypothetical protein STRDD11_02237 [Streptococcus sp. DD11]|uniref:hypothetical protein n=1 Tax=Streptococcus sp. DD11 TaxID=1777879 RepID=UPI000792366C|nr:hypothetical protein [Streptococcus sp. DD11]KXT79647.1 hypothetical protein STRDD11_02237 [Streptococcus sp. DD11]